MPKPIPINDLHVARLYGEADQEITDLRTERVQLCAVLAEAIDLIMAHQRGYFGHGLKVCGRDNSYIAALIAAVDAVDPVLRAEAGLARLIGRRS